MDKRELGRSGIEVSPLGMGCWAIGGPWAGIGEDGPYAAGWGKVDDTESIRAIHAGLDAGITLFDTAANYGCGHSERVLGAALGTRRKDVVIATKFGHIIDEHTKIMRGDPEAIAKNLRQDCENSLRRLQTDYIDLYQLHSGSLDIEPALEVREILESLVTEGKIRAYGWSTDDPERAAAFADGEHCAAIQFQLSALRYNPRMRALCNERNLTGLCRQPLRGGMLTGKITAGTTFPADDMRHVVDFSQEGWRKMLDRVHAVKGVLTVGGRTVAQGALAWIWARGERMIPIPGFRTVEQVRQNAAAMEHGPLTQEQMQEVIDIVESIRKEQGLASHLGA